MAFYPACFPHKIQLCFCDQKQRFPGGFSSGFSGGFQAAATLYRAKALKRFASLQHTKALKLSVILYCTKALKSRSLYRFNVLKDFFVLSSLACDIFSTVKKVVGKIGGCRERSGTVEKNFGSAEFSLSKKVLPEALTTFVINAILLS